MDIATVNGVELEYEIVGSGEPVLLIDPVVPDGISPLLSEPSLVDKFRVIHYHKRGWVGSMHTAGPVTFSAHAADAGALLARLGVPRAHIVGHSTGAIIATQLALDLPEVVTTLTLLELSLMSLPVAQAFLQGAGPIFEAYGSGDHEGALAMFMSAVTGMEWRACRSLLDERIPGTWAQSIKNADTFFGVELPAMAAWTFSSEQAAAINRPVLSVLGTETNPLWVEVADFLRASLPYVEDCTIDGAGHLLQIQRPEPVARAIGNFLARNPIAGASYA